MWKKFDTWACRNEILIFILCGVVLLRIPSLFEPYWYGDEGIYLAIGQAINHGRELYQQIHDNKPPLLYIFSAIAGGNLFWFKFLALGFNLFTVWIFWKLAHALWDRLGAFVSTITFALLTSLPMIEGNVANAELFFLLPTIIGFFILLKHKNNVAIFVAGLLLGIAALIKMPAILEVGVWPLIWLVSDKQWFKKSFILGISALLPLTISIAYYAMRGSLSPYLIAAGLQNVPYLSSWEAIPGLVGTLKGRAIVAGALVALLMIFRRKISLTSLTLGIWWVITLFAVSLSGRPYPHYLLQMSGVIGLVLGSFTQRRTTKILSVFLLILLGMYCHLFKVYRYPVLEYYKNFISWKTQSITTPQYFNWFNKSVSNNYKIAEIISAGSKNTDLIFVWGDEPMIYALSQRLPCGRYTAKYHILDFRAQAETITCLELHKPKYIITFNNISELPGLQAVLSARYIIEEEVGNSQIWRRIRYND